MSDDLVKRLQYLGRCAKDYDQEHMTSADYEMIPIVTKEVADRIEELEAKLKTTDEIGLAFEEDAGQLREKLAAAEKERDEWRSLSEATIKDDAAKNIHYAEIQAKLEIAVKCQYLNDCIEMVDELYDSSLAAKARTTLAELKGEQP